MRRFGSLLGLLALLSACSQSSTPAAPATVTTANQRLAVVATQVTTARTAPTTAPVLDRPLTCADTLVAVKTYHAPGDALSVEEHVSRSLAADRRPVQIQGWEAAPHECFAWLNVVIGNDSPTFLWHFVPETGRVEATNAATKRLSGW